MTRYSKIAVGLFLAGLVAAYASSQESSKSGEGARGKYIVEVVAQCWECHSPRTEKGEADRSRWLEGAPVWFEPIHPVSNWAYSAPRIAGLPGFSDDQAHSILERGVGPNGIPVRPPMRVYHFDRADASAIIAYLRSIGGGGR